MSPRQQATVALLNAALERAGGTHTLTDVIDACREGRAQIWEQDDTLVVTELLRFPRKAVVRVWLCAGEIDKVIALVSGEIETWARGQGAASIEAIGRPGWRDAARAHGYEVTAHVYEKELTP